jgi:hypothetical protein
MHYEIKVVVSGKHISVWVNNQSLFNRVMETKYDRGCIGFGNDMGSRTVFVNYKLKEFDK